MTSQKNRIEQTFYSNGGIEREITYVAGRVNGLTKHWHLNGVLASEIPVKDDMVEGVAKFWDASGKLLGSYEIRNGTGIQKLWFPNGKLMGETPLLDGMITGRQIVFFESGEFCAETYWLNSKKVSKKKYLEACKNDPSLPQYDEPEANVSAPKNSKGRTSARTELRHEPSLAEQFLAEGGSREVLEWLREGSSTRTLGELPKRENSIELAEHVYGLGATKVTAVKIDRYPNGQENTGKLVVSLPTEKVHRKNVFAWAAEIAEEQGYDPEQDTGQKHIFVMLD